jgi:hypothetical protein
MTIQRMTIQRVLSYRMVCDSSHISALVPFDLHDFQIFRIRVGVLLDMVEDVVCVDGVTV